MRWDVATPFALFMLFILAVAVYTVAKKKSLPGGESAHYYLGGRSLGPWVLIFTILASAASAGTFIGSPGLSYGQGYGWTFGAMLQVPAAFVMLGILGKKLAILSRKLDLVTFTDFFKHRYESPVVVVVTSVGVVVFLVAYMVAQFVGGARILGTITGVPYWMLVVTFAGIVALYTAFGGFLAAAFTDAAQGAIMLGGGFLLWFSVFFIGGGASELAEGTAAGVPELTTLPGPGGFDPAMMLSYSVMFGLLLLALPHVAVRAMAYKDSKAMHTAMVFGPAIMALFTLGFGAMGVFARVLLGDVDVPDMALPLLALDRLPGALAGALLAAPIAAVMSTVDSMILVVSGAIVRDLYVGYVKPDLADKKEARIGSVVSLSIGVIVLLLALNPPEYLQYLINFAIGGLEATLFVPLVLGLYWKRGNALGATLSIAGGMIWYLLASVWAPVLAFGLMPVFPAALFALVVYVAAGYFGPPPSRTVLVKFWGSDAEIARLADTPVAERS